MTRAFELRREKHAIGEFSASIHFKGELSSTALEGVQRKLTEVAKNLELEAPVPIPTLQVSIGGNTIPVPPVAGFQRFAGNGEVACSLVCDRNSIVFALREYTRWNEVLPKLVSAFSEIGRGYTSELPFAQSLRIQYLNEFRATSPDIKAAAPLFRPKSAWVAPHVREREGLWHCHVGEFRPVGPDVRYLINVNSDVSAAQFVGNSEPSLHVKILLLCGSFYDVPNGQPRDVSSITLEKMVTDDLQTAHKLERDTLKEVISDEYLSLMGADKDDY